MQGPDKTPRVLMLSDVYFPRVNGVSTSIQTFRRDLANLGCQSWLIAPAYPASRQDEPGVFRVRSRYLPLDPEDRIMIRRDFRRAVDPIADRVDIVHVQTPFLAHYWGAQIARRLGVRLVVSYHTYFEYYFQHYLPYLPAGWLRSLARRFSRVQLNGTDLVIAPSAEMGAALSDYGVDSRIEVLPTGLDIELFRGGDGARFRAAHGIAPDRPVMLTVGRVAFEKNLRFLIEVLAWVRERIPQVLLVIAGEGPALPDLKQIAKKQGLEDNLMFVGYLDRQAGLLDCYRGADVFVFASRTETQGLVLLEAMALGLPVVSTAVMGTRTVLSGAPARVVDEDPGRFGTAVADLLRDAQARTMLAEASVAHVAANWSGRVMAQRLFGMYSALLGNPVQES